MEGIRERAARNGTEEAETATETVEHVPVKAMLDLRESQILSI